MRSPLLGPPRSPPADRGPASFGERCQELRKLVVCEIHADSRVLESSSSRGHQNPLGYRRRPQGGKGTCRCRREGQHWLCIEVETELCVKRQEYAQLPGIARYLVHVRVAGTLGRVNDEIQYSRIRGPYSQVALYDSHGRSPFCACARSSQVLPLHPGKKHAQCREGCGA